MSSIGVNGSCDPAFASVREVFTRSIEAGEEYGASLCVWHGGRMVIDLWGGLADRAAGTPWERDTLGIIFSSTKGLAAMTALQLADRGLLDYDSPVARYWPEFAAHDKGEITVRTLLNHRAGLVGINEPVSFDDLEAPRERLAPILARQRPLWTPGTHQGYHAVTYGMYLGELFWRITGKSLGAWFADEIAGPLEADAFIGLPRDLEPRVARLYTSDARTLLTRMIPRAVTGRTLEGKVYRAALKKDTPTNRAFREPSALGARHVKNYDTPRVRSMELPWANAVSNARGVARVYAALIGADGSGGDRLVSRDAWAALTPRQTWQEPDAVILKPLGWSQGFLKEETRLFSPNPESFGHPGAGGALGWADPKADLAIGYVMNRMDFHVRSRRALALCHALYGCL